MTGVYSTMNGRRPTRPNHPEISGRVWETIEGCWRADLTKRKKISGVVAVLEAEVEAQKSK